MQRITLADTAPTDIPGEGITAHWTRPAIRNHRNRLGILCLPIQGGDYEVSTLFAQYLAKKGFHTLRFERRAEWLDHDVPLETLVGLVGQFVGDVKRMTDHWLTLEGAPSHPEIGLFGVSMGAMTGTLVAANDPRITSQILCIGGGELSDVMVDGRDAELDEWRAHHVAALGSVEAFNAAIRRHVGPIGVLEAAPKLADSRTLFIGARFDRVVPWSASVRLWEALGEPKRIKLPTGHYSAMVAVPWIKRWATNWFDAMLP